jgi:hypothetical protein
LTSSVISKIIEVRVAFSDWLLSAIRSGHIGTDSTSLEVVGDYDNDIDDLQNTPDTKNFKGCRICTDMTAEDCAAEPITECYPYFDYQTDDRACQVTMRSRWTRGGSQYGGTVETLYTSRCVTPQACEDDARQNFVPNALKTNASKYFAMNQCKRTDKLSRRFVHSECTMCLKLATDDAEQWNALFPGGDDTLAFRKTVGDANPASFTTITELPSAPETYMFSNHDENVANDNHPLGQSYDKMQSYNIANTP